MDQAAKTCTKCGTGFNTVNCPACAKEYNAAYRERHKEEIVRRRAAKSEEKKAYDAEYRVKNADAKKAYFAAHYKENREKILAYQADYYRANTEKVKERAAAWYANNPERVKAIMAAWRKANVAARRIIEHNREAQKRVNGGKLSSGLSERLFVLQKGRCACCGEPLGDNYHLDHIMPISLGGANEDWNIQLLRQRCNNQKRAKHPVEFMRQRGKLL